MTLATAAIEAGVPFCPASAIIVRVTLSRSLPDKKQLATASRKRPAESAWRNPGYPAEVRREMALAREARSAGDIADRPIRVPKKIARPLDPSFHHVTVGRLSGRNSECLAKVVRAQLYDRGQFDEPELIGQMRLDVVENAPDLPRRKPTLMPDWRTPRQSGAA
jgi:hypothetical protein